MAARRPLDLVFRFNSQAYDQRFHSIAQTAAQLSSLGGLEEIFGQAFSPWQEGGLGIPKPDAYVLGQPLCSDLDASARLAVTGGYGGRHWIQFPPSVYGVELLAYFCSQVARYQPGTTTVELQWVTRRNITANLEGWWPSFTITTYENFVFRAGMETFSVGEDNGDWSSRRVVNWEAASQLYGELNSAAFYHKSYPEHAIKAALQAEKLDPGDREALLLLGLSYLSTGDYHKAAAILSSAEKHWSSEYKKMRALISYGIGVVYAQKKQYQAAETRLKTALEHHPEMKCAEKMLLRIERLRTTSGLKNYFWRIWYAVFSPAIPRHVS